MLTTYMKHSKSSMERGICLSHLRKYPHSTKCMNNAHVHIQG